MKKLGIVLGITLVLAACARNEAYEIPTGSDVTLQKKDGVSVSGKLVEVKTEQVVLESRDGVKMEIPRSQIASLKATPPPDAPREVPPKAATGTAGEAPAASVPPAPPTALRPGTLERAPQARTPLEFREITLPAGTALAVTLGTSLASDTSKVEDPVRATLRTPVSAGGVEALPVGTAVLGHVTSAQRSAKVKGRASIGVRFNAIELHGGREAITSATVTRVAPTTKKKDATKIGIGAGAGAIIGGIVGGGGGAAKGAAIGGGAGTGAVLATRGDEVRLPSGTPLTIRLTAPLAVRVPLK